MKRNILQIFIASPGDLNPERAETREICQRVNKILSRVINWQVELLGWEDTLPGANRPQEIINQDVEACELFIGLLWKRWGQDTGKYDSGFYEEYCIAKSRRETQKTPEIWLFFKKLREDELQDPGPQLNKVIEFKNQIESEKNIFFKSFPDQHEFSRMLHDYLIQYILKISSNDTKEEIKDSQNKVSQEGNNRNTPTEVYSKDVLDILTIKASQQDLLLDPINLNRVNLFTSLIINNYYGNHVLDNHVINRVYLNRSKFILSQYEIEGILPFLITNKHHPGWYWLRSVPARKVYGLIRNLTADAKVAIRNAAIKAAIDYGIKLV